jgi:hypothetical protein
MLPETGIVRGGVSLEGPYQDMLIYLAALAFRLTGMHTDIAADGREGNPLPVYGYGLWILALGDVAEIAGYVHAGGAALAAGGDAHLFGYILLTVDNNSIYRTSPGAPDAARAPILRPGEFPALGLFGTGYLMPILVGFNLCFRGAICLSH